MVKFKFQFSDSCLCLLKQLSNRACMVMGFWWKGNKILQAVIIPNTIDVMDLPTLWSRAIGIFPHNNMFKYLMPGIGSWMVTKMKKNIAIPIFNSPAFPIGIIFTRLRSFAMLSTKFRFTRNQFATNRAWMFFLFIILFLILPVPFMFFSISFTTCLQIASPTTLAITGLSTILALTPFKLCHIGIITYSIIGINNQLSRGAWHE